MTKRISRTLKMVSHAAVAGFAAAVVCSALNFWFVADGIAVRGCLDAAYALKISAASGGLCGLGLACVGINGMYRTLTQPITT